jgi:hypothetical protein
MALVDAATVVVGTPTVLAGRIPWPLMQRFCQCLRPIAKFLSIIGSYGWGERREILAGMVPYLKVEVLAPVRARGFLPEADFVPWIGWAGAIAQSTRKTVSHRIGSSKNVAERQERYRIGRQIHG